MDTIGVTAMQTDDEGNTTPILIEAEVNPFDNAIADLSTDSLGRLWVRPGSWRILTFRVYDSEGRFLLTAECPELEE